jgi:hypothetical protein
VALIVCHVPGVSFHLSGSSCLANSSLSCQDDPAGILGYPPLGLSGHNVPCTIRYMGQTGQKKGRCVAAQPRNVSKGNRLEPVCTVRVTARLWIGTCAALRWMCGIINNNINWFDKSFLIYLIVFQTNQEQISNISSKNGNEPKKTRTKTELYIRKTVDF